MRGIIASLMRGVVPFLLLSVFLLFFWRPAFADSALFLPPPPALSPWPAPRALLRRVLVGRLRAYNPVRQVWLECVAFAQAVTGMHILGNAKDWWAAAAGHYARGDIPAPGAVLDFTGNWHMPLGHVAVVQEVINSREIVVEHSNWAGPGAVPGWISRNIPVIDVSPDNDWSAVRVGFGSYGTVAGTSFGSIYPTFGFIYNRPDRGQMIMAAPTPSPVLPVNPVPSDFRDAAERAAAAVAARSTYEQVAEDPAWGAIGPVTPLTLDGPDRSLR